MASLIVILPIVLNIIIIMILLPRNCVAMAKDSRSTFPIIDENGCPVDPTIFPRLFCRNICHHDTMIVMINHHESWFMTGWLWWSTIMSTFKNQVHSWRHSIAVGLWSLPIHRVLRGKIQIFFRRFIHRFHLRRYQNTKAFYSIPIFWNSDWVFL